MLPTIAEIQILQFIYSHYHSLELILDIFLFPVPAQDFFYLTPPPNSRPHHVPTFNRIYPLGGQGRHIWQIVR